MPAAGGLFCCRLDAPRHPLGQTLLVSAGQGRAQREDGPIEAIHPGDVIWFEPSEKHWHGAAPGTAMTHVASAENDNGRVVEWLEKVSDAQYHGDKRVVD